MLYLLCRRSFIECGKLSDDVIVLRLINIYVTNECVLPSVVLSDTHPIGTTTRVYTADRVCYLYAYRYVNGQLTILSVQ